MEPEDMQSVSGQDSEGYDDVLLTDGAHRPALLSRMEIRGLFGRYDYDIRVPEQAASDRLVLLYGDNGRGKTTVLKILWHLLSPANNRRHRTSLLEIPFRSVNLYLADGTELAVQRAEEMTGPYNLELRVPGAETVSTGWPGSGSRMLDPWLARDLERELPNFPEELRREAVEELAKSRYTEYLKGLGARPYYLADDRNIYSDDLEEEGSSRDAHRRRLLERHALTIPSEATQGLVAQELDVSLRRVNGMLRQLTLGATTSGSASANSVYLDVLHRLGRAPLSGDADPDEVQKELRVQVEQLGQRSRAFESLALVPKFATEEFVKALQSLDNARAPIANEVLAPYLASLRARLDALQDAQTLIQTFLDETNGFLQDKVMTFTPQRGLRLMVGEETLTPSQFSSGERQLILLLCNAMLARMQTRLFLIDEPELSLNVKWQRKILSALLACTEGTSVQFLVATHSVELLSAYKSNVIRLTSDV